MKRRSLFEKYIPEVAAAISDILGLAKEKVEKPFYETLPVFVRFTDEEPVPGEDSENGAASRSVPPPESSPAAPAVKAKDKNRGKGKQLSLLE